MATRSARGSALNRRATTTVFPSDAETRRFLASEGRAADWREIEADPGCEYDDHDEIDLSTLEPLIVKLIVSPLSAEPSPCQTRDAWRVVVPP